MLAIVQHKHLQHPCEGLNLPVASCLSSIMMLIAPIPPYNDDIMRRVFRLIVETFHNLDNNKRPTFGKKLEILEVTTMVRTYDIMFDLECDDLILQMFQCFFSIRKHHPDMVKTNMQSILSSVMGGLEAICRKLQCRLLAIWRKAQSVSPTAYELSERLAKQNIRFFRRQLTKEEFW